MVSRDRTFSGFPDEAFGFLSDLARNNNKTWFDAHRSVHETAVVEPALRFVESMGAALRTIVPSVTPEPRIGGSLFRIHRDTRFAADKRPYKTHVGIRFRGGDTATSAKCDGPLFYVEFDASSLRLGVGIKEFDAQTLEAYRRTVAGGRDARDLREAIRMAGRKGHDIVGDVLARTPAAYAAQDGNELLKRKGLFIRQEVSLPKEIHGPAFVDYCGRWFAPYAPLFGALRGIAIKGSTIGPP